jgi:hypothetical protein
MKLPLILGFALALLVACGGEDAPNGSLTRFAPDDEPIAQASSTPTPASHPDAIVSWRNPNLACLYLMLEGISTGPYASQGDGFYCMGSLFFGMHLPLRNEIHYMPEGTPNRIRRLQLGAETYNFSTVVDQETLTRGAELAQKLTRAALGDSLPSEAGRYFRSGTPGSWEIGGASVRIEREDHQPGRGFTVFLRISESR